MPNVNELSFDEAITRMGELEDLMRSIHDADAVTDEDQADFDAHATEFDQLRAHKDALQRQAILDRVDVRSRQRAVTERTTDDMDDDPFADGFRDDSARRQFANPWDLEGVARFGRSDAQVGAELRSRALSAVEQLRGSTPARRERMTEILETEDTTDGMIARFALTTTHPDYVRAFWNVAKHGNAAILDDGERRAIERMKDVQRAMSLTDSAGGYLVPFQLDPSVIITSDGSLNQIRMAARQVTATGDVWNGVSAGQVDFTWAAEAAESTDAAPTFAQPTVAVHKAHAVVPISIEAFQDEANVSNEVGRLLAFGKDTLEATAFATGTGSGQPFGIVTAITGEATTSATTDVFALEDVYAIKGALPARYRQMASWLANDSIYDSIRQFDTTGGASLWTTLGNDRPDRLIGRSVYEAEGMDGSITATQDNYVLIFGDFSNYVIADRVGFSVELIPHLFGTTANLPTGQRGWYAYYRVGADSVNDSAFEILNVT